MTDLLEKAAINAQVAAMARYRDLLIPRARRVFIAEMRHSVNDGTVKAIQTAIAHGEFPTINRQLIERVSQISLKLSTMKAVARDAWIGGGMMTARALSTELSTIAKASSTGMQPYERFNTSSPYIISMADQFAADMVTQVTNTTRGAINQLVQDALANDWTPVELADALPYSIGLIPDHVAAVDRYKESLLESETPRGTVKRLVREYADRLLNYRALMIARTEMNSAINAGRRAYYSQLVKTGIIDDQTWEEQWVVTNERTCPICLSMNGETKPIGNPWLYKGGSMGQGPPLHPSCGCTTILTRRTSISKSNPYRHEWHGYFGHGGGGWSHGRTMTMVSEAGGGTGKAPPKTDKRFGAKQRAQHIKPPPGVRISTKKGDGGVNRNDVTDTYERLMGMMGKAKLESAMGHGMEHTAGTRDRTFPADWFMGKYAVEVKSVGTPTGKGTIKLPEKIDKLATAEHFHKIPATILNRIDPHTMTAKVFLWKGEYVSRNGAGMEPLFSYKITAANFMKAHRALMRDRAKAAKKEHPKVLPNGKPNVDHYGVRIPRHHAVPRSRIKKDFEDDAPEPGDTVIEWWEGQAIIYVWDGPDVPAGTNAPITWMHVGEEEVNGINPQGGR